MKMNLKMITLAGLFGIATLLGSYKHHTTQPIAASPVAETMSQTIASFDIGGTPALACANNAETATRCKAFCETAKYTCEDEAGASKPKLNACKKVYDNCVDICKPCK